MSGAPGCHSSSSSVPEDPSTSPADNPRRTAFSQQPVVLDPSSQRWGLGEVALGFLLAQVLAVLGSSVAFSAAGWTKSSQVPLWAAAVLQVPLWGGYLGAVFIAGKKGRGMAADFGLSMRGIDVPVGLVIGAVVQLVVVPLLYVPILRLSGTDSNDLSAPARALADKATGPVGWLLLVLIVVVGAPVVEELFFRGLFLRSLQKCGLPDWAAIVISAAVFGAVHFQLLQFVGLFAIGLVLAAMAVRTGRLGLSIFTHMGFNATSVALLYLGA